VIRKNKRNQSPDHSAPQSENVDMSELYAESHSDAIQEDVIEMEPMAELDPEQGSARPLSTENDNLESVSIDGTSQSDDLKVNPEPDPVEGQNVPVNPEPDPVEGQNVPVNPIFIELDEKASRKHRPLLLSSVRRRSVWDRIVMLFFFAVMVVVSIVSLFPILLTVLNSFMSSAEIETNYGAILKSLPGYNSQSKTYLVNEPVLNFIPDMVSFKQYATLLFKSPAYLFKFWNSIMLVVPIVLGQLAVGSLAAYSFARYRRRRREILFFSYIILMLMPFQVTLVPNYIVAQRLNIFNSWAAIILPGIFSTFSVFLLTKYMRQIPSSYIEAAKLDGAGEWHIFWHICIPTCKSALYAISILLFIDYWNMVEQPLLLLENTDKHPLSVFLSQINQKEIGIAFAASFIFMIPPLLMFFYGEQYLIEGISRSGIK